MYSADRVTGFLESQDRAIADLDDLNGQIDHSVVMREMSVSDAAPQLVSLDEAEVDRLGEGSVQIEARQTDAVGNVHEGGPATSSFVIDTIDPEVVTIADDQDGTAFDGADQVTYTLSFSEAVQSVTETDLTVTGAAVDAETGEPVYSVTHTPDTATASVTVTVADNSIENVSVSVNSSIVDIAGNPLIQAVDNTQTVDTVNPEAPAISVSDNDATEGDAGVGVFTVTGEAGSSIEVTLTGEDGSLVKTIDGADGTAQAVTLSPEEVTTLGNGSVQIEASQTDEHGNISLTTSSDSFVIDTIDPEVSTVSDDQDGIAFDGANVVTYTLSFSEAVQSVTETDLTVTGAEGYTVSHEAGSDTASVTVTVADNSIENVSVSVNSSIVDIAGNPLIQVVDNSQTVDTVNPSTAILHDAEDVVDCIK